MFTRIKNGAIVSPSPVSGQLQTAMKAKNYNKIVGALYHATMAINEAIDPKALLLADIEALALPLVRAIAPKVTKAHAPDIALQATFDVIGLCNNEKAIRQAFEDTGAGDITFFRLQVGHTFIDKDGNEDSDSREYFVPMSKTQADQYGHYYDALDKHFEQLSNLLGETLEIIETVEVIEI